MLSWANNLKPRANRKNALWVAEQLGIRQQIIDESKQVVINRNVIMAPT